MPVRPNSRFAAAGALGLLFVALLGLTGAAGSSRAGAPERAALVLDAGAPIAPGDLIFRRGDSLASRAVLAVDDSIYSHVGIVVAIGAQVQVAHAAPGEDSARPELLKIEPVERFLAPELASAAAVYRPVAAGPGVGESAAASARRFVERHLAFDARFSLATVDELYCTELVWRAYLEAGVDLLDGPAREIDTLVVRGPVILPGDLLGSSKLRPIYTFKTKESADVS